MSGLWRSGTQPSHGRIDTGRAEPVRCAVEARQPGPVVGRGREVGDRVLDGNLARPALLTRRRETGPSVDPEVAWVWNQIAADRGWSRIDELAVEVGWSRKRLWSRFRSHIGLPPKRAAKLVRFDHAAHRLPAGEEAARVAAEGGYVDQSHLHRDVLAFSRATPATVAGEEWLAVDDIAWGTFVQDPRP
jgi:AraC-like DNA-binding protein